MILKFWFVIVVLFQPIIFRLLIIIFNLVVSRV